MNHVFGPLCVHASQCPLYICLVSPRCNCAPNWFGILCSSQVDDCSRASHEALCGHGTCVSVRNTHAGRVRLTSYVSFDLFPYVFWSTSICYILLCLCKTFGIYLEENPCRPSSAQNKGNCISLLPVCVTCLALSWQICVWKK